MTLDTTVRRVNYQGDDRTTCFPFSFKVWGIDQVVVYCSDPATPWTETNITSRATVTLNEDNYGGAVVFASPLASGTNLAIVREGSFLQEDEYLSGSRFDAHEIEDRFDEDAAERQELLDATARSIKVPNSSTQTPEEVYEELLSGSAFVNNALAELNEKIEQANYWYNIIVNEIGNVIYSASKETSFIVSQNHIIEESVEYVHSFTDGFFYYPKTNQLLVTVDGLILQKDLHYQEMGEFGEQSVQLRFLTNLYQGQQVYIKASFIGTEEFDVKLEEMDSKINDANESLQDAIESANADFEDKTNELNELIKEATDNFQNIIAGLDEEIAQTDSLIKDALEIVGTTENWESFQEAITELNNIYGTFTSNELPTQGYCELDSGYYANSCLTLPGDVCYFKDTNTLHLAVDGLVLSPKYFEEVGGCICTPSLIENGLRETVYCGADFVKIPEGVCLYKGQELHAWTESFWGREGWEPEEYQPDITTRLYATSTAGCIYHSDDLGRTWCSSAARLEDTQSPEGSSLDAAGLSDAEGSQEASSGTTGQLPEYLKGQRIVATSDTLWAFAAGKDDSQGEDDEGGGENGGGDQEQGALAASEGGEDSTPSAGTLMCSSDGGLTWNCYIKENGDSNDSSEGSLCGSPYAFAATDDALVLATCCGIFCCSSEGEWCKIFPSNTGGNTKGEAEGENINCHWGLIEPASDGSGFLAVDTTPAGEDNATSTSEEPKRRQIVYFGSISSDDITCSCTNSISDVTAIAGNGRYWVIADADGQVEYAANCPASDFWQTSASLGCCINRIYGAREGFVALGSGSSCTNSPRNAWKCPAELDGNGTLCAGLHLPDHGLYLAVGCSSGGSNVLWGWDGLNWNCGCCVPSNATLNNIWTSEHLPFFTNEPVTELEAMWPAEEPEEGVPPEDDNDMDSDSGSSDPDSDDDGGNGDGEEEGGDSNGDGDTEGGEGEEEPDNSAEESLAAFEQSLATFEQSPSASEDSPAASEQHCYLWGPISHTYQLKSDLCFDGSSIPVRITLDQCLPDKTGEDHGNGATIDIYYSGTYQRLTRDDILPEAGGNGEESQEESSPQTWCKFASYEACGPICANTELYTCFATPQSPEGSGVGPTAATEPYPTCWPAGYYAAAIYCVYGGCSLQNSIPNINFYVSRKERFSSAEGLEPDDADGSEEDGGQEENGGNNDSQE